MLTLQELKQVVSNREERRKVPSARYLRENDVAVVKQRLIDGAEIIAYRTGYIFYCAGDYAGTGRYENIIIAFHIAIFQKAGVNWWIKGRMYLKN